MSSSNPTTDTYKTAIDFENYSQAATTINIIFDYTKKKQYREAIIECKFHGRQFTYFIKHANLIPPVISKQPQFWQDLFEAQPQGMMIGSTSNSVPIKEIYKGKLTTYTSTLEELLIFKKTLIDTGLSVDITNVIEK